MNPASTTAVLIPVKGFTEAKSRLANALAPDQRAELARRMATNVVKAANELPVYVAGHTTEVIQWAQQHATGVIIPTAGGLDRAVATGRAELARRGFLRVVIAHGDLPLAQDLSPLARPTKEVVIITDRQRDGTNVISLPTAGGFCFGYGPGSARYHHDEAVRRGWSVTIRQDDHLSWDVDTVEDLTVFDSPHILTPPPDPAP